MQEIVRAVAAGQNLEALLDAVRRATNESFSEVSDRLLIEVAEEFLAGRLTFDDADLVANTWWFAVCRERHPFTELAYAVFGAFEAGEYDHGDGSDPIERHTIPLLRATLQTATASLRRARGSFGSPAGPATEASLSGEPAPWGGRARSTSVTKGCHVVSRTRAES